MGTIFYKIKTKNDGWIYGYASRLPQNATEINEKQYSKYVGDEKEAMKKWGEEYELTQAPIRESIKNKLATLGFTEDEINMIIK